MHLEFFFTLKNERIVVVKRVCSDKEVSVPLMKIQSVEENNFRKITKANVYIGKIAIVLGGINMKNQQKEILLVKSLTE